MPEEIILAVLSNFKGKKPADVLKGILSKLQAISGEEITLRKYIRQLSVLARLRNLTKETQKQVTDMGLLYDITKDYLYQEGLNKGREEAEKKQREAIAKMLAKQKLSVEEIAELFEVTVPYVEAIAKELKK